MKKVLTSLERFFYRYTDTVLYIVTSCISVTAILYFYFHGQQNLAAYDAVARLNIARKILDSITPGIGQLGGIWLPFPQVLMLPFIWNDFLWHSGLAGAIVSGAAFVVGAVYLKKTALHMTKSIKASLLVWILFITSINILLLQSMALSETFFMFCLIMVIYFLTKWIQNHHITDFLLGAFFVTLITLTRYEGYFVFIGALLTVLIECIIEYRREGVSKIDGMLFLFLTVAGYGIFLWCLYCVLFYKDPLYWLHLYSSQKSQVATAVQSVDSQSASSITAQASLVSSFLLYGEAILALNGIVTVMLGIAGLFLIIRSRLRVYMPLVLISAVLFIFLIYGYHKGFIPEIVFPFSTMRYPLDISFNPFGDTNIRYGIIMAPLILLFAGFAASKNKLLWYVVIVLAAFQFITNVYKPQLLQLSLPILWQYPHFNTVSWFRSHYDGGLILISANRNEDFIFQTGLPYSDFIYEGSRQYWMTSLNNPAKYAKWVIYSDSVNTDYITYDTVHDNLTPYAYDILHTQFKLMYNSGGFKMYRILYK